MTPRTPKPSVAEEVRTVPASEVPEEDLRAVFGSRGVGAQCLCQRYKLARGESFAAVPVEVRWQRLVDQAGCGQDDRGQDDRGQTDGGRGGAETSGLVGYLGAEAVGWCAVEPRPNYTGLVGTFRVPWDGRDEDRTDASVWAITCLFTRAGHRRQEVSRAMARAAVAFAEQRGAAAVEAYPMVNGGTLLEELHVGTPATFEQAGLREVLRPSKRRAVMRIDLTS